MGKHAFSDTLKIARGAIDLWDLLTRVRNGIKGSATKIRRLMYLTGEMTAWTLSLPTITLKRKTAMSYYNKLKKTATQERVKFGKKLIQARAIARNTTVAAQEKQLKNAFGQRQLAQRAYSNTHLTLPQTNPLHITDPPSTYN